MKGPRTKAVRILVSAAVVVPTLLLSFSPSSSAAPSAGEVAAAEARKNALSHQFETAVESYNEAMVRLQATQTRLSDAKHLRDAAAAKAERFRARLSGRAVDAYTGMGTQLDTLLGADDFSEFSDRLEYMGAMAQSDAELAAAADRASQEADWAAQDYANVLDQRQQQLQQLEQQRKSIEAMLQQAQAQYQTLSNQRQSYLDALAAQQAAAQAAAQQEQRIQQDTGGWTPAPTSYTPPAADASKAAIAIAAAKSVIGTPYVWGAASPSTGFDCSGLTSWAWAQAGVYISHSAAAQYASLPRVSLSAIQPGDIIYYGNFGPQVALYIGGGTIIHATHPGAGGGAHYDSLYGYDKPWGAVRPA
jgi:cell wall-associated NlpC family hydrolase